MKKYFLFIIFIFGVCHSASLWQEGHRGFLSDYTARNIGDSLTVIIEETIRNNQTMGSTIKNTNALSFGPGTGFVDFMSPATGMPNKSSFESEGKQNSIGEFKTEITVRVIEVLNNKELVIEGSKSININNEKQYVYIKGIVKPENITKENTVLSTYIANAEIAFTRDGEMNNVNEPGWITKIFNTIF
jgi:flagellar L-ring protein FlgH